MNNFAGLSVATFISLSLNFVGIGEALAYSFSPITVSESSNPWLSQLGAAPSLNDNGTIAFWVYQNSSEVLYTADNGSRNLLADNTSSPVKYFLVSGNPVINNQGTVAVYGDLDKGGGGILTFNGQSLTTIADTDGSFLGFPPSVAINDKGTIVFGAEFDTGNRGIFTSNGGSTKQIAELPPNDPSNLFDRMIARVAINNSGNVGFINTQQSDNGVDYSALFINDSSAPIADSNGEFYLFSNLALNDRGNAAFSAHLDSGNQGIFLYDGKKIIDFASNNDSSSFKGFNLSSAAINNQGTVAFLAQQRLSDDTSYQGIFTGSNSQTDKVIAVGDELLGSKVKKVSFSSKGLNNLDQIAFYAELENGSKGFFLANPESKSVPEPGSVLALLAVGAYGVTLRRSQGKKA